jgi:hypothetical protein
MKDSEKFWRGLEAGVNASPFEGGLYRKARYIPHLEQMQVETLPINEKAIIANTLAKKDVLQGRRFDHDSPFGGYQFQIPVHDLDQLRTNNPDLFKGDPQDQKRAWERIRILHPEWVVK